MKPTKLHMKNIGPYRDETIDFSALDNMFLIKGDTGAGKTFIFDAITYALYGKLRGNRKSHESDMKSRYADESEESYVDFEFETGGKKYKVYRTVPFKYTNKKGKILTKPKEVRFSEIAKGNGIFENENQIFANQLFLNQTETDKKIAEIIGLDVDEFAQIVLLPQGEFAEFLHQNSKQRAETLKTLFPVDFYSNITEKIAEKTKNAQEELKLLNAQIQAIENGRNFSDAENLLKNLQGEIENLEKNEAENQEKQKNLAAEKTNLEHELKDAKEFEENKKSLQALLEKQNYYENLLKKIEKAEKALELKEFISAFNFASLAKNQAQNDLQNAENEQKSAQEIFEKLENQKSEMQNLSEKNKNDSGNLQVLNEKIAGAKELPLWIQKEKNTETEKSAHEKNLEGIKSKIAEEESKLGGKTALELANETNEKLADLRKIHSELQNEAENCKKRDKYIEEKSQAEKNLTEQKQNLEKENQKFERTNATIKQLEEKKSAQELKNQAYSVSVFLKKNAPCPVCGSVEHPNPAEKPEGLLDYGEQIKTFKENLGSIQTSITLFTGKISKFSEKIENAKNNLEEIKTKRKTQEVEDELEKKAAEIKNIEEKQKKIQEAGKKISELENLEENLKEKAAETEKIYLEAKANRENLEKMLGEPLEDIISKRNSLQENLQKNTKIFADWEEKFKISETKKEKSATKLEGCQKNLDSAREKLAAAEKILNEKIEKSIFATLEEAKSASAESEKIEYARKTYNDFCSNLKAAQAAVKNGESKNLDFSENIEKKIGGLKATENQLFKEFSENRKILNEKKAEQSNLKSDFDKLKATKSKFDKMEKEIEPLKKLNDDLSGKNPKKIRFEAWALAMYFEQVVSFASKRFFEISDGRFSFELKKDENPSGNGFKGLDLQVFDSHTGKFSDPAELSGGETFEASISLALAMTDVVQNSSGGIQLDSLFIDEGFGTLDPETLEKAMSVLTELGETKMIGMISHVSEMEDFPDIKSSIKVNKTNAGSTVEIFS